jgi:hypothetical protein
VVAAGACSLFAAADVGAQTIQFTPSTLASLPSAPGAIASADFNGDGRADVAVASPDSSLLSVFLQQPGGSLSSPASYTVCARPSAVSTVDVNDDGAIDLLVASRGCSVVSVLINTGSGSFVAAASRSTGARPVALATGDFNRDGHADFATANVSANTITIRLGTGTGAFSNPQTYSTGSLPVAIVASDFNRDGKLDLATANAGSRTVSVRLGRGNGNFDPPIDGPTTNPAFDLATGDFNGDGIMDLALSEGTIEIWTGIGDGGFFTSSLIPTTSLPLEIVAADFNRDGRLDLATVDEARVVRVLPGRVNGTFGDPRQFAVNASPALAAVDFTIDGKPDLVAGVSTGGLDLLRNATTLRPSGGAYKVGSATRGGAGRLAVADIDRDGREDVIAGGTFQLPGALLLVRDNGTVVGANPDPYGECCFATSMVTDDFNRDGIADVARMVVTFEPPDDHGVNSLVVQLGSGNGAFTALPAIPAPFGTRYLVTGDFTNDGRVDVVAWMEGEGSLQFFRGRGNGTFAPVVVAPAGVNDVTDVKAADVNGDGALDLLLLHGFEGSTVVVRLGRGDGTFDPPILNQGSGDDTNSIAVGDFNHDGRVDFAIADLRFQVVSVFLGRGDGTSDVSLITLSNIPEDVRVGGAVEPGDFDRDGHLDLAVGIALRDIEGVPQATGSVQILHGRGDGTFVESVRFNVRTSPLSLAAADFDRDGRLDLAIGGAEGTDVVIALNSPDIAVAVPNTPVNWGIGSEHVISWSHSFGAGAVFRVDLNRNSSAGWTPIAQVAAAATSGRFRWTVTGPATTRARIRVVLVADEGVSDISNVPFTIAAPFVAISSPSTPVTWTIGSTRTIQWSHNLGTSAVVHIDVSRDGGATWSRIADAANTGESSSQFRWVVTGPATDKARLRVTWTAQPSVSAVTATTFRIRP